MIEYRTPTPEEYRTVAATISGALMVEAPSDERWEKSRASWDDTDTLTAWDGERCTGSVGAYRLETVVPGGALLATAGVTRVGMDPTYRRRGIARELLTRLLTESRERGQVLASLRASEAVIYRRFGFGIAGDFEYAIIHTATARPIAGTPSGSTRLLARDAVFDTVEQLYPRVALNRPGTVTRPRWMVERYFEDAGPGVKPSFVAVHSDDEGNDDGFVHYSVAWTEQPSIMLERGRGEIHDLWGATPAVERELWRYVCSIDLVDEWHATERPLDDVIRVIVADPRAVSTRQRIDEQWLRVLDVDAALGARQFTSLADPLTIEVTDEMFAANCGRWTISDGKVGRDDSAAAHVLVSIDALSAVYLGGASWWSEAACRTSGRP